MSPFSSSPLASSPDVRALTHRNMQKNMLGCHSHHHLQSECNILDEYFLTKKLPQHPPARIMHLNWEREENSIQMISICNLAESADHWRLLHAMCIGEPLCNVVLSKMSCYSGS